MSSAATGGAVSSGSVVVLHVAVPSERERRGEHADRRGRDDAHRLFDRCVAPDRAVEAHDLIDEELHDDRDQQVRDEPAHTERQCTGEPGEICRAARRYR